MKTKKRQQSINPKSKKNKTVKHLHNPFVKTLKPDYPLYASKKYDGKSILEYTKKQEKLHKTRCFNENMTWFGDYEEARHYKTKENKMYEWKIKKETRLINMNEKNTLFFKNLFQKAPPVTKFALAIQIGKPELEKINKLKHKIQDKNIDIKYLTMTQREKALYEFQFAYGYISAEEQYQFMKFIRFLIENNIIEINRREGKGTSILTKLIAKINYYYLLNKTNHQSHNRLSFYLFDKCALNNLCKLLPKKYKIEGVFQADESSFWFPDLVIYKMNIKEYVLFNPHHNLLYVKEVIKTT
jgi:hypothetical protein